MNVVLLGAPGAGKGTHAKFISEALNIPIVSAGNLLRGEIRDATPLGNQIKATMDAGDLIPDEITIRLMRDKLKSRECERGVIIDGFPRTLLQAEALDGFCSLDAALCIEVSEEVIVRRMAGRRTCPRCQQTFHVESHPPKTEGICDFCGTILGVRDDDRPEVVRHRFEVYHELTEPIKNYYEAQGKLRVVYGKDEVEETKRLVFAALGIEQ